MASPSCNTRAADLSLTLAQTPIAVSELARPFGANTVAVMRPRLRPGLQPKCRLSRPMAEQPSAGLARRLAAWPEF